MTNGNYCSGGHGKDTASICVTSNQLVIVIQNLLPFVIIWHANIIKVCLNVQARLLNMFDVNPTFSQCWYEINSQEYILFILVMCILLQRSSNSRDFVKCISGKMSLSRKELIARKLLLRGKIKKVLSHAHVCSLEQRAGNAHDQNKQTLHH